MGTSTNAELLEDVEDLGGSVEGEGQLEGLLVVLPPQAVGQLLLPVGGNGDGHGWTQAKAKHQT